MSLSGNTAKINELISKINALPEAGSGGGSGGGVETCTVTVRTYDYYSIRLYNFTTFAEGSISNVASVTNDTSIITIENVVCNSPFSVKWAGHTPLAPAATITGDAVLVGAYEDTWVFLAPDTAGSEVDIYLYDDD